MPGTSRKRAQYPQRRADFTYEYTYPDGYLLGMVVVDTSTGDPLVTGLHLKRMAVPVEELNALRDLVTFAIHVDADADKRVDGGVLSELIQLAGGHLQRFVRMFLVGEGGGRRAADRVGEPALSR